MKATWADLQQAGAIHYNDRYFRLKKICFSYFKEISPSEPVDGGADLLDDESVVVSSDSLE